MGLFSLLVTNCIVNKENRAFVHYLELKVQQACNKTLHSHLVCRWSSTWPSTSGIFRQFPLTVLCKTSDLNDVI